MHGAALWQLLARGIVSRCSTALVPCGGAHVVNNVVPIVGHHNVYKLEPPGGAAPAYNAVTARTAGMMSPTPGHGGGRYII